MITGSAVYYSRSLDLLCDELVRVIREPLPNPLQSEWIMVQSVGVSRWLTLELSRRLGVCANVDFLLPNRLIARIAGALFPEEMAKSGWINREVLQWRIFEQLPALVAENEVFTLVRLYLERSNPGMRRLQFSEKMAGLFDQYVVQRPEMILEWEAGGGEGWQPVLWRAVVGEGVLHPVRMLTRMKEALERGGNLPARVSAFGISTLPPFHVNVLKALSSRCQITLLVNRPASGSWGDLLSTQEARRTGRKALDKGQDLEGLYLDEGNRLVASLGKSGRDFASVLSNVDFGVEEEIGSAPEGETLLRRVQRQIFEQEETCPIEARPEVLERDLSLQFHACHSPMREMEVLHDYLIDCFQRIPDLKPSEVVVMAPDLTVYAPLVGALFRSDSYYLPYSLADRIPSAELDTVQVLLAVLNLAGSRYGIGAVLDILDSRPVRLRFEIGEEEGDQIHDWLEETKVRWGLNGAHREKMGYPKEEGNSWEAGIQRLLLGYAMSDEDRRMFNGVLPLDNVEGSAAEALAKFLAFFEELKTAVACLEGSWSIQEWHVRINQVIDRLFDLGEETQNGVRVLHDTLKGLVAEAVGMEEAVERDVFVRVLSQRLGTSGGSSGFLGGGITFCQFQPMRAVPFRVIALLGMNDGAFPRQDRRPRFDLMQERPRAGDRSLRDDDRYVFLETIMAAGDGLFISYLGRSLKDNSELAPSVVVNELIDYLGLHFRGEGVKPKVLTTDHRLHGFHPDYFKGSEVLFSYSNRRCQAATALVQPRQEAAPFFTQVLEPPKEAVWRHLTVDRFLRFFQDPCKVFLKERMGISLESDSGIETEESEPFLLSGLDEYWLKEELLGIELGGGDLRTLDGYVKAQGVMPLGTPGTAVYRKLRDKVQRFSEKIKAHWNEETPVKVPVHFHGERVEISGNLKGIVAGGQILYRSAKLQPKDLLGAWIRHLLLGLVQTKPTVLIGSDETYRFEEILRDDCQTRLQTLCEVYWKGICAPLPFTPVLSMEYAEWLKSDKYRSQMYWEERFEELEWELYFCRCFDGSVVANPEFATLAEAVWGPLLEKVEKVK